MLTNDIGEPVAGQDVELVFTIYDDPEVGTDLWTEPQTASTNSIGVASVVLGSVNPIDIAFSGPLWLEVQVGTEILSPRRELVTSPYAFYAANSLMLDGLESSEYAQEKHTHTGAWTISGNDVYRIAGGVGIGTPGSGLAAARERSHLNSRSVHH
jgi:hypothetical protein